MVPKSCLHQDGNQTKIFVTVDSFMIRSFLKYKLIIGNSEGFGIKSCNFYRYLKFETKWHLNLVYIKMTIILKYCYNLDSFMFRFFLNNILSGFKEFGLITKVLLVRIFRFLIKLVSLCLHQDGNHTKILLQLDFFMFF